MNIIRSAIAFAIATIAIGAQAGPVSDSNSNYGTFDDSSDTRRFVIAGAGTVTDVNITIDFGKCDDPAMGRRQTTCDSNGEEFAGEIYFFLTGPDGTRVDLVYTYAGVAAGLDASSTRPAGTYDGTLNVGGRHVVTFDDQATALVGPSMLDGTFRPEEALSAFNGINGDGAWRLTIGDSVGSDPLSFFNATLTINATVAAIPEPEPLALVALGATALAFARRRARRAGSVA